VNDLIGNRMEGTDGEMGKVEEFYFDDRAWIIVYLLVKTGGWLSGREVLISPDALIKGIRRFGFFPVNLTKEQIKTARILIRLCRFRGSCRSNRLSAMPICAVPLPLPAIILKLRMGSWVI
jgi:PRC-barrel domain